MAATHLNIILTQQEDAWHGDVHTCGGWIARWADGDTAIAVWGRTRKAAYSKAYRFARWNEAAALKFFTQPVNGGAH